MEKSIELLILEELKGLKQGQEQLVQRFDGLEQRIDRLEKSYISLERRLGYLEEDVTSLRDICLQMEDKIDKKIGSVEDVYKLIIDKFELYEGTTVSTEKRVDRLEIVVSVHDEKLQRLTG